MQHDSARTRRRAACFALAIWACGCAGGPKNQPPSERSGPVVSWTVRVGSEGGFTGGGSGHLVLSDGTVRSWSQFAPGDTVSMQTIGRADPKALRELQRTATAPDLVALRQQERGNMTAFFEWIQGREVRRYSWTEHLGNPSLPPPLQRAYVATLAAIASAHR